MFQCGVGVGVGVWVGGWVWDVCGVGVDVTVCACMCMTETHPSLIRWLVFSGALSALGLMTFLSVCLGFATLVIPRAVTFYVCTVLLALFGFKLLYDGWKMSPNEGQEEFEEVSEELRKREEMVGLCS